jgi:hypothetical protein
VAAAAKLLTVKEGQAPYWLLPFFFIATLFLLTTSDR